MYTSMVYDEWVDTYKPIPNKIAKFPNGNAFETYGEELDFVRSHDEKFIWTEVDGDGGCYIINGYHFVNRIQYYVCEVASLEPRYQEVVVNLYQDCSCLDDDYNANPDCQECEGSGMKIIYVDTREELIELKGEKYANEQI